MLAVDLAKAMAAARARLPSDLAAAITADRAWALSVLLAAWGGGKRGIVSGLPFEVSAPVFFQAFDFVEDTLLPIVRETYLTRDERPEDIRIAGLGVRVAGAVSTLGAPLLKSLTSNDAFRRLSEQIQSRLPMPAEVRALFGDAKQAPAPQTMRRDKIRGFDGFDAPRRPPDEDLAFLRRQLDDPRLDPAVRMYYEEKMRFRGLAPYRSDDQARTVWQSVLSSPLESELQAYYTEQLQTMTGSGDIEV
jgi:hypothetical protein